MTKPCIDFETHSLTTNTWDAAITKNLPSIDQTIYCPAQTLSFDTETMFDTFKPNQELYLYHARGKHVLSKWAHNLRFDLALFPHSMIPTLTKLRILKEIKVGFQAKATIQSLITTKEETEVSMGLDMSDTEMLFNADIERYLQFYWHYEAELLEDITHDHIAEKLGAANLWQQKMNY